MHFAYKKAYLALFAMSALILLLQPDKVNAVASQNETKYGLSAAGESYCEASNIPVPGVIRYIPNTSFVSYEANSRIVYDMRSPREQVAKKDKASYASFKMLEIEPEVVTDTAQPEIIQVEVKAESIAPVSSELNADTLLGLINEHRVSLGLPALQKDDSLMQIARERAPELFDEIFVNGNMHAGFHARNLPYFATENIIYNQSEAGAFRWWLNSGVHRAAIQNPEYTHTGIACAGKACAQIFTAFKPRI